MKTYLPWKIFMPVPGPTDFCLPLQFVCSVCIVCALYVCVCVCSLILACFPGAQLENTIERTHQHHDVSAANRLRVNNTRMLGQQRGGQTDGAVSCPHTASE